MTMAIDPQQRQFGGMTFDHMPPYSNPQGPHFTNPWASSSGPAPTQNLYASSHALNPNMSLDMKPQASRMNHSNNVSMQSYASVPITAASAGSSLLVDESYGQDDLLTLTQDMMSPNRMQTSSAGYDGLSSYATAPSSSHPTYVTSTPYEMSGYAPAPVRSTYALQQPGQDMSRRLSQPSVPPKSSADDRWQCKNSHIDSIYRGMQEDSTRTFGDAIDASRGMIAMSQNTTPRNIYGPGARTGRGSGDSYGFPSTHSTSSSISSTSNYPSYFGGSVDSSVSDYSHSNAGSDMEGSVSSRTLPRPSGLLGGGIPPAPQSMMGQFSSKVSSSTQKKHKCKVCEKRFTRPSSLQTHMYSHTGEKRKLPNLLVLELAAAN
jgi:hypothetical protein